jgi:hypothetical protein
MQHVWSFSKVLVLLRVLPNILEKFLMETYARRSVIYS